MINRIDRKFDELRQKQKKAFIPYVCFGDPDISISKNLVIELANCGADIIELGFPFSDPLADGHTIQKASQRALKNKITLKKYLDTVEDLRRKNDLPLVIMSYYNPIFKYGEKKFVKEASDANLDGAIIPDLPPEEAKDLINLAKTYNFHLIFLASPTSSDYRLKLIAEKSCGFIYYVSSTGVTGARKKLPFRIKQDVEKIKKLTTKPVCVGFGVSKNSHIKQINRFADGVVVGSAIIDIIEKNIGKPNLVKEVRKFVKDLKVANLHT